MTEQTKSTISPSEYYDRLERLDWTYEMSDDHSVWRRGSNAMGEVQALYADRPELKELFDKYREYIWSDWKRKPDGTPDYEAGKVVPKPERPKDNVFRAGESNASEGL